MPYPHGADCRCPAPTVDDGLLAFTVDCAHYRELQQTLARIAERPDSALHSVSPPLEGPACDGSMTCPCAEHAAERARHLSAPRRRVRQPWEPRPARQRAA
jgi:hypothetical protein